MLETPKMKIVKLNDEHVKKFTPSLDNFMNKYLMETMNSIEEAEKEIIKKVAEEEGLSFKCAKYFIYKHFNFITKTEYPNGIRGSPKLYLTLEPKPVEQLLEEMDDSDLIFTECDKELIENTRILNEDLEKL